MSAVIKQHKCKECGEMYTKNRTTQQACKWECALKMGVDKANKKARKEFAERKRASRTKSDWLKLAQVMFNKYIRLRDKDLPCISCQRHHKGQYHAGHYRSVGACAELRFNEDNCHKQCSACNNFLSGNAIEYRINLVKKIGLDRVVELEGPHEPKHYIINDIQGIREKYRVMVKAMEKAA